MSESTVRRPRRRVWKIVLIVVGIIAALFAAFVVQVQIAASARWAQAGQRARELVARAEARPTARPTLMAASTPGNAWDDYRPAMLGAGKIGSREEIGKFVDRLADAPDLDTLRPILAAEAARLIRLRAGAARESVQYGYDWKRGFSMELPGLLDSQSLAQLALAQSRLELADGRPVEALDLLLSVAQLGRDLGSDGSLICEMIGIAILNLSFYELADLLRNDALDAESLARLEDALERLDASFPSHGECLRGELTSAYAGIVLGSDREQLPPAMGLLAWRYGFSARLMLAAGLAEIEAVYEQVAQEEASPWSVRARTLEENGRRVQHSNNFLVALIAAGTLSSARAGVETRSRLRLLREAAHWRRTGERLSLEDPFGGTLRFAAVGDDAKLWSLGRDATDQGGVGDFKVVNEGSDLVLDVGANKKP